MIEVRFRDFGRQVAYIQFLVHGVFLSMLVFIRAVPYWRVRAGENAHASPDATVTGGHSPRETRFGREV
jgi:hypothetical protein